MKYLVRKVLEVEVDTADYAGWDSEMSDDQNVQAIAECVDDLFWDVHHVEVLPVDQ